MGGAPGKSCEWGGARPHGGQASTPNHSCYPPQWAVVGDTFPVGCRPQASVVFCDSTFQDNPDLQDPRYRCLLPEGGSPPFPGHLRPLKLISCCSTEFGMYQPHCGLENVLMSWGHDGETCIGGQGASGDGQG